MRTTARLIFLALSLGLLASCDKDDEREASIQGLWRVSNDSRECPDELTFLVSAFSHEDWWEVEEPCKTSDVLNGFYTIEGSTLTLTYERDDEVLTFTIIELTDKTLKLRGSNGLVEFLKVI